RRHAYLPVALQRTGARGGPEPRARRGDLSPGGLGLGAAARAGNQSRLVARGRISRIRLARLQRGDAGLSAGAGLADLRGWAASLDRMDQHLRQELAQGLRPGIPELRAPLR